ncbi:MAG: penicillin-binding protein 2, partial [Gammaproteobacteria bacterium]|nr:penicillin-binding protein 2 [Gammaproteobacteria bacterium]
NNLYLTIDSRLQKIAEDALGKFSGSVVAIDPNNGEILALVSMPTFDPNLFVNGISVNNYRALRGSPRRPLFNRALAGQYPPGSTTKPFFALAGLESNSITTSKTRFCGGYYILPKETRKFRDWKKWGHGKMDMMAAITQSCDVYFYDLAYKMGIDLMSPFLAQFGFGEKTGIDSTGEKSGLLPSREWKLRTQNMPWFPGETLNTSIGQGYFLVTPLQLANSTAAMSQKGKRFRPHLVRAIGSSQNEGPRELTPEVAGQYHVIKAQNWEHIRNSMINVVHGARGTARGINRGITYTVAGKTGTAQVFGIAQDEEYDEETVSEKLRDHALFISYAPAEDPRIAVAVIVENGEHGSTVAAPIARQVMDAWLQEES